VDVMDFGKLFDKKIHLFERIFPFSYSYASSQNIGEFGKGNICFKPAFSANLYFAEFIT
jgi:hypothetical protein